MKTIENVYPCSFERFTQFYKKIRSIEGKKATYVLKRNVPAALRAVIGGPSQVDLVVNAKITKKKIEATTEHKVGGLAHVLVVTTYTPDTENKNTKVVCKLMFMNTSSLIQGIATTAIQKEFEIERTKELSMLSDD